MKFLKHFLFMLLLMTGLSVAAMAQKDGDKQKPPPKGNPPVVVPREKPPRDNPPKGGTKPKKPGGFEAAVKREDLLVTLA